MLTRARTHARSTRRMPVQKPGRSKQNYETLNEFIRALCDELNIERFQHDFAASARNSKGVTYWGVGVDSLSMSPSNWKYVLGDKWGFLNPPFAQIGPWARLCWRASTYGAKIALLTPASVGSNWFKRYVDKKAYVKFLNSRLHFMGPDEPAYPKDCMVSLYGPEIKPGYDVWSWRNNLK